jgi:iron complex transport system ATP-binding protein
VTLQARDITFRYERKVVLDGASLEIRPGQVTGLVGPNGAGKSTLVRVLSGVVRPGAGEVLVDGTSLARLRRRRVARLVAVAQQSAELPDGFRVREVVAMGRSPHLGLLSSEGPKDRAVVEWAMRQTGVEGLHDRNVWQLSGGEKQRVVLARALAQEPRYLLLDEPTTHLDLRYQVEILRHVRRQAAAGLGILVVLHDLNLAARSCDSVVVLAAGRVEAEGAPGIVLDGELVRRVYGADVERLESSAGGSHALLPRF